MKELHCSKEIAFKSILKAAEHLKWLISDLDEPKKVTLQSPTTLMANGQRYIITILSDSPCSLSYSIEGIKVGPITARPSNRIGEKQMQQLFTLMDAEIGDADDSVVSGAANEPKAIVNTEEPKAIVNTEEPKPAQEAQQNQVNTENKKEAAMREIQEQQQGEKKRNMTILAAIILAAVAAFSIFQFSGSNAHGIHMVGYGFNQGDFIEIKSGGKALFYQAKSDGVKGGNKPKSGSSKSCYAEGKWEKTSNGGIRVSGLSNTNCGFISKYNKTYNW